MGAGFISAGGMKRMTLTCRITHLPFHLRLSLFVLLPHAWKLPCACTCLLCWEQSVLSFLIPTGQEHPDERREARGRC